MSLENPQGIKAGDLVIIVKHPAGHKCTSVGIPFKVTDLRWNDHPCVPGTSMKVRCGWCGWRGTAKAGKSGTWLLALGGRAATALYRLKKLDPDALKDDVPAKVEEPA